MRHSRLTSSRTARAFNTVLLDGATLTVGCLGLAIIGLAALRCFWPIDLSYNEGWNAYFQAAAFRGDNVYPLPGTFVFNNYPPLSFIVIGTLARFGWDVVEIGRLISLGSVLVIAFSSGVTVSNLSNWSGRGSFVAAAVCLAAFCLISPGYIGMNDPQLFGQAIMTIALAVYTRAPERTLNLLLTVLLMAIAGMIKFTIVAAPIAIALDVVLRSRRRAVLFLMFSVLALLCCTLWLNVVSDGRVWSSLVSARLYSFSRAAKLAREFFASAFPLVIIGAIGVVGRTSNPGPRLVASYGVVALLVGGILGGGAGVDLNIYFDVIIASALGVGLLTDELVGRGSTSFVGIRGQSLAALLIVTPVIGPLLHDSYNYKWLLMLPDDKVFGTFSDSIAYLRARPGDAICRSLLLCFRAGKPFIFDVFNAKQAELTGGIPPGQISDFMESGVVKTVQLTDIEADMVISGGLSDDSNTTLLKEVGQIYELHHRSMGLVFFVAR